MEEKNSGGEGFKSPIGEGWCEDASHAAANIQLESPLSSACSVYPFNRVERSLRGHLHEVDDTLGCERIKRQHCLGSYEEYDPQGSRNVVLVKNDFTEVAGNKTLVVYGDINLVVHGNVQETVHCNKTLTVGGDYTVNVHGNHRNIIGKACFNEARNGDWGIHTNARFTTTSQLGTIHKVMNNNLESTVYNGDRVETVHGNSKLFVVGSGLLSNAGNYRIDASNEVEIKANSFDVMCDWNMNFVANFGIKLKSTTPITLISDTSIRSFASSFTQYGNLLVQPPYLAPDIIAQGNIFNFGFGYFFCWYLYCLMTGFFGISVTSTLGSFSMLIATTGTIWFLSGIAWSAGVVLSSTCWSDARLKRNYEFVKYFEGIPIYRWNYFWDDIKRIGPIAQDLLNSTYKSAVQETMWDGKEGYLIVDQEAIPEELKIREEK